MNRKGKKYLSVPLLIFLMVMLTVSYAQAETKAIFIGTSKFKNATDLPACEDDAKDMKKEMFQKGIINEEAGLLLGPNRKSIIKYEIEKAAKSLKEGDTLIIFNASHGNKDKGIVTWDNYISGEELSQWIAKSKCSRVLLINDSCFSGNFSLNIPGKKVCQINSSSPPMVSFTSGVLSKHGRQNGVFTKYLLGALNLDNSDSNGDGNVSANEIVEYVKKKILFEESVKLLDSDSLVYKTLQDAKEAMELAYNKYFKLKEKGSESLMWIYARDYLGAKRIYEEKMGRVEMRWQQPTITGDTNFVVVPDELYKKPEKGVTKGSKEEKAPKVITKEGKDEEEIRLIARGKLVPRPGFLESIRVKEYENYLELRFNQAGGEVTGSFKWRYGRKETSSPAAIIFDEFHKGNLTGDYSGGKAGSFQGKFTGTIANTVNGTIRENYSGPFSGSWLAEMDDKGHISGYFKYLNPAGEDKRLNFEATLSQNSLDNKN